MACLPWQPRRSRLVAAFALHATHRSFFAVESAVLGSRLRHRQKVQGIRIAAKSKGSVGTSVV